jgi:class 3 adenylate cyclase
MAVPEPGLEREDRPQPLTPGWDRRDSLTLRFVNPALERDYRTAMAPAGRYRLRIANLLGAPVWIAVVLLGARLLPIPTGPLFVAAGVNAGWELVVAYLTLSEISLEGVWALCFFTTVLSGLSLVLAFGTGTMFITSGAAAVMTNAAYGIALVRPAAWVAALLGALSAIAFAFVVLAFHIGSIGVYQIFLMAALLAALALGARYLEGAERKEYAQGQLVAALHKRVDQLFRQYLSPEVAQALVDQPTLANLGGEVTDVTVLFADLQGFTPFAERMPANEVVAMLNTAYGAAVPAVFAEGGTVVQFVGDALMAVFNAPIRQEDHALRACRAALSLQRAMADDAAPGTPRFRVGINSGPALVGNVGSEEMHNYLAIGDTTNVAARLQTFAPAGTVVLGQQTYDLVRDCVEVRALGQPELKGKTLPTEAYELMSVCEAAFSA